MICEDTCGQKKDKDHIRKKNESFQEIRNHLKEFLDWMIETFPDERALVEKYHVDRYQVFYLYIPQNELNLTADERALYEKLLLSNQKRFRTLIKWLSVYTILRVMKFSVFWV